MDWQQVTALSVVVLTAGLFGLARWRRSRKARLPCDSGCGCGSQAAPPRETVIYHARKGQRPEIIVKSN
jgi:hypothetical protein